jgi:phosphatidylinositol glycan class B
LWNLFIKKEFINTALLALGVLLIVMVGIVIDHWFYGQWTVTAWNYFDQNIIKNKVSDFGIEPWWFYIKDVFNRAVPPFSAVFIGGTLFYFIFKRKDILSWTLFPFLFIHFIIGHKETRFLFPIIGFMPVLIVKSIEFIQENWKQNLLENKFIKTFAKVFFIVNAFIVIIVAFKPANDDISLFGKIYSDYTEPTVVNYIEHDPYRNIYFYRRANLEVKEIKSVQEINITSNKKQLLVTDSRNISEDIKVRKKLIFFSLPGWLLKLNFNNWVERSGCWYVYELY